MLQGDREYLKELFMVVEFGNPFHISIFGFTYPSNVNLVATFGWIGGSVPDDIIIPDHVARTLSLLIEEFKRSPLLNSTVKVIVNQQQEIEFVGNSLLTDRRLSQAGGAQLDGIGSIVGEPREGRSDEVYREAIEFRIYINVSNAEPETLIAALKFTTNASRIKFWELGYANIQMFTNGSFIPDDMVQTMDEIAAGGVSIEYISTSGGTLPFAFAIDGTSDNPEGGGWNELGYTEGGLEVGGQFVEGYFT